MPEPENSNFETKLDVPFTIYADFESILKEIDTCIPNSSSSFTTNVQQHIPCAFAYFIKCSFDNRLKRFRE